MTKRLAKHTNYMFPFIDEILKILYKIQMKK